jgi:septal ring factor EnvC (AmiA/AmiB activator)
MRGFVIALVISPLLVGSALAQDGQQPLDQALKQAEAEQAAAEAQATKLEKAASHAKGEADRLHAEQAAAAQAIDAAEARISAANVRLQLTAAQVAAYRGQLAREQQPVSSLLAGLATMARRPPLLVLADRGGTDELVKVRLLLASTIPVIRARTSHLTAELAQGERLQNAALAARFELAHSRDALVERQQRYAALESQALQRAFASSGQALGGSDIAIAATESVERLRGEQSQNQSIRRVASQLAMDEPAPASPFSTEGGAPHPPFAYALPATASVTEGLGAVNESGVRSRGLTLATARGVAVTAPADGVVKFAGPFRDYDGVLIIDHGGGWLSLIVNVASTLHQGERVGLGQEVGRALGPLQVELSQNGRRISPALIAGSSPNLSKRPKGG